MFNLAFGFLVVAISLLLTRLLAKRWQKVIIIALGVLIAGVVAFFPLITKFLHSRLLPTDREILQLLYGEGIPIQESLDGKSFYIIEELSTVEKEQFSYAAQVNTQVVEVISGWNGNPQKYLVLTRTGPPACCDRSQLPVLGGALFSRQDGTWQVNSYQKLITPYGGFDSFEIKEIKIIGPQKTVVVLEDSILRNGISQTWDLLLGEVDGDLKVIARIETSADNTQNCPSAGEAEPCWLYAAVYQFEPGKNPDYQDIVVTTTGTELIDSKPIALQKTTRFMFLAGQYRLIDEDG